VLVANAGSSSLKLTLLDADDSELWTHQLEAPRAVVEPHDVAAALVDLPAAPDVVGHRIVHGGQRFREAVCIEPVALAAMRELSALAPLHQPKSLAAVDAVSRALSGVPAVACFDTAFHATLPPPAATYALPRHWRERFVTPLRFPRALACLCRAAHPAPLPDGAPSRQLSPRRRSLAVRGARRALGRHHDGLHAP